MIPQIKGVQRKDGAGLKVWCDHCSKWHLHGHGLGHRTADCENPNSPYKQTGYEIID